jgi:hypothetical protein
MVPILLEAAETGPSQYRYNPPISSGILWEMDVPSVSWYSSSDGIFYLRQVNEILCDNGLNFLEFNIRIALRVDMELGRALCIGIMKKMLISSSPYLKNELAKNSALNERTLTFS